MINLKRDDVEKIIERKIDEQLDRLFNNMSEHKLPNHPNDEISSPKELNLKPLLNICFTDDYEKLLEIFSDEDTVIGVISTLQNCPEEIQVVAKIALDMYKKIDVLEDNTYENQN